MASSDTDDSSVHGEPTPASSISSFTETTNNEADIQAASEILTPPVPSPVARNKHQVHVIATISHLSKAPSVSSHIDEIVEWALFPPPELIPPSIGHSIDYIVNWALFPPTELMLPSSPPTCTSKCSSVSLPGTLDAIDFLFPQEFL